MAIRIVLTIVVLAVLGAVGFFWFQTTPSAKPIVETVHEAKPALQAPPTSQQEQPAETVSVRPPTKTPMEGEEDVLATLLHRADSGDSNAACQLGVELKACTQLDQKRKDLERYSPALRERQREGILRLEQRCGIFTQTAALDAAHWRLRAALGGNHFAKKEYVRDTSYLARAALQRPELVRLYAVHAPEFLREAISEGDRGALLTLASALRKYPNVSANFDHWLRWAVKPDPVLARTYAQTYLREYQLTFQNTPLPTDPNKQKQELFRRSTIEQSLADLQSFNQGLTQAQIDASDKQTEELMRKRAAGVAAMDAQSELAHEKLWRSFRPEGPSAEDYCNADS